MVVLEMYMLLLLLDGMLPEKGSIANQIDEELLTLQISSPSSASPMARLDVFAELRRRTRKALSTLLKIRDPPR